MTVALSAGQRKSFEKQQTCSSIDGRAWTAIIITITSSRWQISSFCHMWHKRWRRVKAHVVANSNNSNTESSERRNNNGLLQLITSSERRRKRLNKRQNYCPAETTIEITPLKTRNDRCREQQSKQWKISIVNHVNNDIACPRLVAAATIMKNTSWGMMISSWLKSTNNE